MKKIYAVMLTVAVLLLLVTVSVYAEEISDITAGDTIEWELSEDGVLSLNGSGSMYDYVYHYDVPWYDNNQEIKI